MIEEDLDEALDRRSLEEGVSKAALVRRFVRMGITPLPPLREDPLWTSLGQDCFEPAGIDDTLYR
jgi:hypothetical protein